MQDHQGKVGCLSLIGIREDVRKDGMKDSREWNPVPESLDQ